MAQVQLTTDVKSFAMTSVTSVVNAVPNKVPTTTQPTGGTGSVLIGSSLNYLKVKVVADVASIVNTITVTGWSFWPDAMAWVPQTLCVIQCTPSTASQVGQGALFPNAADATVFETATYVKSVGDAKIYNAPSAATNGGFFLVDTLGSQFIDFHASSASGSAQIIWILTSGL
jgi:hypothetical protein